MTKILQSCQAVQAKNESARELDRAEFNLDAIFILFYTYRFVRHMRHSHTLGEPLRHGLVLQLPEQG